MGVTAGRVEEVAIETARKAVGQRLLGFRSFHSCYWSFPHSWRVKNSYAFGKSFDIRIFVKSSEERWNGREQWRVSRKKPGIRLGPLC